jgi:three-Cys-motif partner protein
MPLDGSAGHGTTTATKQEHFTTVLGTHMATAMAIIAKSRRGGWRHHPKYVYFDLNAGPGIVGGHVGSPLIFLRLATERRMPFEAHFFEKDPASAAALKENIKLLALEIGPPPGRVFVATGDSNGLVATAIDKLETRTDRTFGLVYTDPNNHQIPIKAITTLAEQAKLQKIDFLFHVAGTAYKRVRGASGLDVQMSRDIRQAGKKLLLIRDPIGAWQWTFALATNWVDMPPFKSIGFHRVDQPDGEAVERRINSPLPKGSPRTGRMPSTSVTRRSSPSAPLSLSALADGANGAASIHQPNHTISNTHRGAHSTYPRTC